MTPPSTRLQWTDRAWRGSARAWIRDRLADLGVTRAGPMRTAHLRPWSIVLRVPTDRGSLFFKATAPSLANDAALTRALAARHPDLMLTPLAVDTTRRWMLLPYGGRRLRAAFGRRRRLAAWKALLPRYAELQREMLGHEDRLLGLGALDRRPSRLVGQLRAYLDDPDAARVGHADGLTAEDVVRLRFELPAIVRLAQDVEATGIGVSIQHDDLHDGNVFVRDGELRIFDWGDAAISHPLATFVGFRNSLRFHLELDADAPELRAVRDAYLEPWTADYPRPALEEALRAIERVYPLMRGLTWTAAMASLHPDQPHELRSAPAEWIREFWSET